MIKLKNSKTLVLSVGMVLLLLAAFTFLIENVFTSPRKSSPIVKYRISETATTMAITRDLKYFDFVKHESALKIALLIKGKLSGKDIQKSSVYKISQSMTAWQIAKVLLNNGTFIDCGHDCPESNFDPELLPGGDLAPTIKQKYEWVTNYEDCIKSIGRDGGQLSSEQYFERTGIKRCVAPDGREFTQGKDGWSDVPTP